MDTKTPRTLALVAIIPWLVVAGYGLRATKVDDGDGWEGPYLVFAVALIVGALLVVVAAALLTQQGGRRRLRMAGLIVSGVGVAATIVAWALPLWMTVLGIGLAMVAAASAPRERRTVALLAAGQLIGMAALFAGIVAEVGQPDEYGDYPAAGGIALIVTAVVTIGALIELARTLQRSRCDMVTRHSRLRRPWLHRQHGADAAPGAEVVEAVVDLAQRAAEAHHALEVEHAPAPHREQQRDGARRVARAVQGAEQLLLHHHMQARRARC